jgi:hypothetical protein
MVTCLLFQFTARCARDTEAAEKKTDSAVEPGLNSSGMVFANFVMAVCIDTSAIFFLRDIEHLCCPSNDYLVFLRIL